MHRYLVFIILAVVLNVDYLELDEYDLASPASVEASGTIELKEMESVIGELFEMSGVSRGEGETRAVRLVQQLAAAFSHLLISWFWSRFVFWFWSWSWLVLAPIWPLQHIWEVGYKRGRRVGRG